MHPLIQVDLLSLTWIDAQCNGWMKEWYGWWSEVKAVNTILRTTSKEITYTYTYIYIFTPLLKRMKCAHYMAASAYVLSKTIIRPRTIGTLGSFTPCRSWSGDIALLIQGWQSHWITNSATTVDDSSLCLTYGIVLWRCSHKGAVLLVMTRVLSYSAHRQQIIITHLANR